MTIGSGVARIENATFSACAALTSISVDPLNRQMARTYLLASAPEMVNRTWQDVMNEIPKLKTGSTQVRWGGDVALRTFSCGKGRK
jgi:hypothetical protein